MIIKRSLYKAKVAMSSVQTGNTGIAVLDRAPHKISHSLHLFHLYRSVHVLSRDALTTTCFHHMLASISHLGGQWNELLIPPNSQFSCRVFNAHTIECYLNLASPCKEYGQLPSNTALKGSVPACGQPCALIANGITWKKRKHWRCEIGCFFKSTFALCVKCFQESL